MTTPNQAKIAHDNYERVHRQMAQRRKEGSRRAADAGWAFHKLKIMAAGKGIELRKADDMHYELTGKNWSIGWYPGTGSAWGSRVLPPREWTLEELVTWLCNAREAAGQ